MLNEKKITPIFWLIAIIWLIALFGLTLGSMQGQSPTFDEGFYIARGWAFWRTGRLLALGHPVLTNLWNGWPLLLEPGLPDPAALDGWEAGDPERVSEDLLWGQGDVPNLDIVYVTIKWVESTISLYPKLYRNTVSCEIVRFGPGVRGCDTVLVYPHSIVAAQSRC